MIPARLGPTNGLPGCSEWHPWHLRNTRRPASGSPGPDVAAGCAGWPAGVAAGAVLGAAAWRDGAAAALDSAPADGALPPGLTAGLTAGLPPGLTAGLAAGLAAV